MKLLFHSSMFGKHTNKNLLEGQFFNFQKYKFIEKRLATIEWVPIYGGYISLNVLNLMKNNITMSTTYFHILFMTSIDIYLVYSFWHPVMISFTSKFVFFFFFFLKYVWNFWWVLRKRYGIQFKLWYLSRYSALCSVFGLARLFFI